MGSLNASTNAPRPSEFRDAFWNRNLFLNLVGWGIVFLGTNVGMAFLLRKTDAFFLGHAAAPLSPQDLFFTLSVPGGMFFVAVLTLLLELKYVGWQRSGLRALLTSDTASRKTDLFYFALSLSGLRPLLGFAFSLGLTYAIQAYAKTRFPPGLLGEIAFPIQLSAVFLVNSFLFYVVHRIMHTRWFWEIHRTHHSAEQMTLLTPHRNHPIDFVVVTLVNTIPAAFLGASPMVIALYNFLNGVYQSLVHSNLEWRRPWVDRYFLITPEAHRVHHSNDPRHWDKNFGIFTFWDRLFGTHSMPDYEPITIGFREESSHNTGHPAREIYSILRVWLRGLVGRNTKTAGAGSEHPAS